MTTYDKRSGAGVEFDRYIYRALDGSLSLAMFPTLADRGHLIGRMEVRIWMCCDCGSVTKKHEWGCSARAGFDDLLRRAARVYAPVTADEAEALLDEATRITSHDARRHVFETESLEIFPATAVDLMGAV